MKKVIYIITLSDWGGAQRYVFDLASNLGPDFDATIAYGQFEQKNTLGQKCAKIGLKTHNFSHLVRPIKPLEDLLAVFEICNRINEDQPDIVHLNSSKAGILGSFACMLARHKPEVIYTVHGWVFMEPMNAIKKWLYIFLERLASRRRDKIIVLGEREKQIALQYKICPPEKLQIAHHNIPEIHFLSKEDAREKLNLPQNKKIIGAIANFYPAKGIEYLIEAATKINNQDVVFAVIGDGALRKNFQLSIFNYQLQNRFLLLGEKEDAAQYLKAFDLLVLPSIKEGAPYVILEAMAAELPIIATNVGNVKEMLQLYQNKEIIPPADVEGLVKAINEFVTPPNLPL